MEGQAQRDILRQQPHACTLKRTPRRAKAGQTLLGFRPHVELEQYFRAADFFVQMSHREGSGYAVIEALACGTTPLVSDIAPLRRVVGSAGSLTPVGDAAALADAMVNWAGRDASELRRAARARFDDQLTFDTIGRDLRRAYETLALAG